jgi:hypothetical protein
MRTSLNNIKLVDDYIFNTASIEDALVFDAMLIINPVLNEQVIWQKRTHKIVQLYSRKKLKAEIELVHQHLFNTSGHQTFRQKILGFFNTK